MALAPLRKCTKPGCNKLVRATRCEQHAKQREPDARPSSHQRGYDAAWRAVRDQKLSINPLCEDCEREGWTTAAEEVHHVEKVADRPELRLEIGNLMSLCKAHHSRRTARGE